jgi:hypothetical protein
MNNRCQLDFGRVAKSIVLVCGLTLAAFSWAASSTKPEAEPVAEDPRRGLYEYNLLMHKGDAEGLAGRIVTEDNARLKRIAAAISRADAQVGSFLNGVNEKFGADTAEQAAVAIGDRSNRQLAKAHGLLLRPDGTHQLFVGNAENDITGTKRTDPIDQIKAGAPELVLSEETLSKLKPEEREKIEELARVRLKANQPSATQATNATGMVANVPPSMIKLPPVLSGQVWKVQINGQEFTFKHGGENIGLVLFPGEDTPSLIRQKKGVWMLDVGFSIGDAPQRVVIDTVLETSNHAKVLRQELSAGQFKTPEELIGRIKEIKQ